MIGFYKSKKVLITGHTGFKGTWLCKILNIAGANVAGYSLEPMTEPNLFSLSGIGKSINSFIGDIRDIERLKEVFSEVQPEIVIHMAAQPIVSIGYQKPVYTYETNIMGTVNVLECVRLNPCVKSFLNVTTDKVYKNTETDLKYCEHDSLGGHDPYSNSKSCSELVTECYKNSFFFDRTTAISTARAGNVIGGGDFSIDRIIPDSIKAACSGNPIQVRNPYSIRPYQHVLEPLFAYLLIAQRQYENANYADNYNVGPDDCDCITTGKLIEIFCNKWGSGLSWNQNSFNEFHETNLLKLDSSKLKSVLNWKPKWHIEDAVEKTIEWTKCWLENRNISECMDEQIMCYYFGGIRNV